MKNFNLIFVLIAFAMLTITSSCKKDSNDNPVQPPDYDFYEA